MFKARIQLLDGLRALAIIAVFNLHFFAGFYDLSYFAPNALIHNILATLHSSIFGVTLFFILSGYLIYGKYVASPKISAITDSLHFIKKRLIRLLPAYILTTCLILLIPIFNVHIHSFIESLRNFTLVSLREGPNLKLYNPVAWTLAFEFQYIVIVALTLLFPLTYRKQIYFVLLALYCVLYHFFVKEIPLYTPDNILCLFLGSILFELHENNVFSKTNPLIPLVGVISVCYFWGNSYTHFVVRFGYLWIMSLVAVLIYILLSTVFVKNTLLNKILNIKPLVLLGKISYSFYLTHYFVISYVLNNTLNKGNSFMGMWYRYVVCFILSVGVSALVYFVAEYPFLKLNSKNKQLVVA